MTGCALRERGEIQKPKLRIGLLLQGLQVTCWQWALFQRIHESDYARIRLVVLLEAAPAANGRTARRRRRVATWLRAILESANNLLEKRVTLEPDAFALRDARELLAGIPTIRAGMGGEAPAYQFADTLGPEVAAHGIDVFIN